MFPLIYICVLIPVSSLTLQPKQSSKLIFQCFPITFSTSILLKSRPAGFATCLRFWIQCLSTFVAWLSRRLEFDSQILITTSHGPGCNRLTESWHLTEYCKADLHASATRIVYLYWMSARSDCVLWAVISLKALSHQEQETASCRRFLKRMNNDNSGSCVFPFAAVHGLTCFRKLCDPCIQNLSNVSEQPHDMILMKPSSWNMI